MGIDGNKLCIQLKEGGREWLFDMANQDLAARWIYLIFELNQGYLNKLGIKEGSQEWNSKRLAIIGIDYLSKFLRNNNRFQGAVRDESMLITGEDIVSKLTVTHQKGNHYMTQNHHQGLRIS